MKENVLKLAFKRDKDLHDSVKFKEVLKFGEKRPIMDNIYIRKPWADGVDILRIEIRKEV